jgi:hypothetical protein
VSGHDSEYEQSGPSLALVLSGAAVVSMLVGVLSYKRYADSERWVGEGLEQMDAIGAELDVEGCIDAALAWQHDCDIEGANAAVCQQAVKIELYHCLVQADRSATCDAEYSSVPDDHGKWVFQRCEDRGTRCIIKRECGCAEAYRAVESFCHNDQKAVQL